MNKRATYLLSLLILQISLLSSCDSFQKRKIEEPDYVDQGARVRIPGTSYDRVILFSGKYSRYLKGTPLVQELPKEKEIDHDIPWYSLIQDSFSHSDTLYPAHHADLNVALWHQVNPPSKLIKSRRITFVYQNEGKDVGGIHVDFESKRVWTPEGMEVFLSKNATDRIEAIYDELRDLRNHK